MEQQSTVEERFKNKYFLGNDSLTNEVLDFIKSEIQLAEQKAREEERHKIECS